MTKAKTKSDDAGRRQIEWLGGGGGNDADGFGVVEAGRDAEAVVTAVKEQQQQEKKRGANNCLFDATIEACGLIDPLTGGPANSQALREKCDEILKKEGFPLIPHGEPAGEQYLQALSLILNKKIKVYKGNRNNFVAEIKHSDVGDDDDDGTTSDTFSIVHVGSQLNGHWVAF